jgi:hypothetical protein
MDLCDNNNAQQCDEINQSARMRMTGRAISAMLAVLCLLQNTTQPSTSSHQAPHLQLWLHTKTQLLLLHDVLLLLLLLRPSCHAEVPQQIWLHLRSP